jgi:phospholipase C
VNRKHAILALAGVVAAAVAGITVAGAGARGHDDNNNPLQRINHIVVIYEENHSFDNLYGGWEGVNGRANADAAHTAQVNQAGTPFTCLKQLDVNLTSPSPLPTSCTDSTTATTFVSAFTNMPFKIDTYLPPTALTCPQPGVFAPNGLLPNAANLPGGCTRDIVHRFYQEK